jgi:hypothetical protein
MANRAKLNEEARKDAEAFFRGDSLRTEVFLSRQGRPPSLARNKIAKTASNGKKDP